MATRKQSRQSRSKAGTRKGAATRRRRSRSAPAREAARAVAATEMPTLRSVAPPPHERREGERPDGGFPEDEAASSHEAASSGDVPSARWVTSAEEDLRLREEAAAAELRRRAGELRREAGRDEPPPWGDAQRNVPTSGSLAREIAIAAGRLGVTLATAPFRIAWAMLRPRTE